MPTVPCNEPCLMALLAVDIVWLETHEEISDITNTYNSITSACHSLYYAGTAPSAPSHSV